jgi:hypothetical protein
MTLADLIDLEARIVARAGAQHDELAARDRQVGETLAVDPNDRGTLLAAWLAALRAREPDATWLGAEVARGYRLAGLVLVLAGLASGWAAAAAATTYDGTHPVNVLVFLGALVGLQLVLLVLGMAARAVRALLPDGTLPELVRPVVRGLATRWARHAGGGPPPADVDATLARIQTRRSLYRPVERGLVFALAQLFGVAFNLGALVSLLGRIVLSDIAFGWSTTVRTDPATVLALVRAVAAPWAGLVPAAVPTAELVAATQYSRYSGDYLGGASDLVLVGEWWPFLVACLVVYGLGIRLVLLVVAAVRTRWALAHLPLDTPDVEQIVRGLRHAVVRSGATGPEAPAAANGGGGLAPARTPVPAGPCALVAWRDAPTGAVADILEARLGLRVTLRLAAGGRDYAADEATRGALAATRALDTVVFVAEAWETPDEGFHHLLRDVRAATTPSTRLLVALVDADGQPLDGDTPEAQAWRRFVARLHDPWVGVEALGG